jgi:hypothetical protein
MRVMHLKRCPAGDKRAAAHKSWRLLAPRRGWPGLGRAGDRECPESLERTFFAKAGGMALSGWHRVSPGTEVS